MPVEFDIFLTSKDLFDEVWNHCSANDDFIAQGEDRFVMDGLRCTRAESRRGCREIEEMDLIKSYEGDRNHLVYLDDDYDRLEVCFERGLRTIWLNTDGKPAPDIVPVHDAELLSIEGFSRLNSLLDKPTLKQCHDWWDEWNLPDNVRNHSQTVAWGAYVLAVLMRKNGYGVDPILTHRGGLLHDLDKIKTLNEDGQHGQMGADFLLQQGYPAMAEIVREHIMHRIMHPEAGDLPWEVKLVYFTDKLVEGDQIVTFDIRQEALMQRYSGYRRIITAAAPKIYNLSDQICSILSLSTHEQLIAMLNDK